MDYVREILLRLEDECEPESSDLEPESASSDDLAKLHEHLTMLIDEAGLVSGISAHSMREKHWHDLRLTWQGHEYLDNIRDPEIWRQTKSGAEKLGGLSLDILSALAKGLIKKKIEEHTGIKIDL